MVFSTGNVRLFTLAALAALVSFSAQAADPAGTWTTAEGKSRVKVSHCGQNLCGTLAWLREPNDDSGQPKRDIRNANAALHSRALIGIPILLAMAPSGDSWSGRIYNAEDGKTYSATFKLQGDTMAQVQGCVAVVFCKSQVWKR